MRRALLAVAVGVVLFAAGGPAQAQDTDDSALGIRQVDSTDSAAVEVTFFYTGERDALTDLTVREGDRVVEATPAVPLDDQQSLGVVLVIDSSKSMEANALIERVREAAHAFVDAKAVTDQIAIVNFDGDVTVAEEFTTDEDRLHEAIDAIALEENTAVWDGIVRSAHLYDDSSLQPNIIVFSDGADNASTATAEQAQAAVTAVGGTLFAIGVENSGFDQLAAVARATGGEAAVADDPEGVGAIFDEVQQTLRKQYVTTFVSETTDASSIPITLTVGTASDTKEYVPGSNQQGAASLAPVAVEEPSGPAFFRSPAGLALGMGLVALAVVAIAFSVGSSFFGGDRSLQKALSPYADSRGLRRGARVRRRRRRRRQGPAPRPDPAAAAGRRGHRELRREAGLPHHGRVACWSGRTSPCDPPRRSSSTPWAWSSSRCCCSHSPTARSPRSSASSSSA